MIDYKKTVFCFALHEEARDNFNDLNCLFTGMGKINATYSLTKYLLKNPHIKTVVNLGTCGAKSLKPSSLVYANVFYQRDWCLKIAGFSSEEFEKIEYGKEVKGLTKASCGTGDSFVTEWKNDFEFEIVDMEAFALAKVCQNTKKDFFCIKSVSDVIDSNSKTSSEEQWSNYLDKASLNLRKAIDLISK